MNNPGNVPRITDPRFARWDELDPTWRQLHRLKTLLHQEGIDAAELYGAGFTRWIICRGGLRRGVSVTSRLRRRRGTCMRVVSGSCVSVRKTLNGG